MRGIFLSRFSQPRVCIILCTFNGERYIEDQILSILKQSYKNWVLYVSDDGSTDQTLDIVTKFQKRIGNDKLLIQKGPSSGHARNFLFSCKCINEFFDFYAFCDQDDIWFADKLERSVKMLKNPKIKNKDHQPKLYASTSVFIDKHGSQIGNSPCRKGPSFGHSLVECIAGGNTMFFNQAAKELLSEIPDHLKVMSHDWLLYQLVTAVDGLVVYDKLPSIYYRVHGKNTRGIKHSLEGKFRRARSFLSGEHKEEISANVEVLKFFGNRLCLKQSDLLEAFELRKSSKLRQRIKFIFESRFNRTNAIETTIFKLGAVFFLV